MAARAVGRRKTSTIGVDPSNTKTNTGAMTPQRQIIYEEAMTKVESPEKLLALADAYQKEGLPLQATMLRKAARLRALPPDVQEKRKAVFIELMSSTDKAKVLKAVDIFTQEGCWGSAEKLRQYAQGLD